MVRLGDVGKFVAVRNQWRGVNLALLDEAQNLCTIAAVHAARFEGQILAVHLGQGTAVLSNSLERISTGRELLPIFTQSSLKLGLVKI